MEVDCPKRRIRAKMVSTLLCQPFSQFGGSAKSFLQTALDDDRVDRFIAISAWIRSGGIDQLDEAMANFVARGGRSELLFGVDFGASSREALSSARSLFTTVDVVHDRSGGTFHPKVYLAHGAEIAYMLVGSNNATDGGLWFNFEAAAAQTFNPSTHPFQRDDVVRYARLLRSDSAICVRVTDEVETALISEGWLPSEASTRRFNREDSRRRPGARRPSTVFGASSRSRRDRPRRPSPGKNGHVPASARAALAVTPDRWFKKFTKGDAQHPSIGNHTGNVTLTDIPAGWDRARFFREDFFRAIDWKRSGERTEIAKLTVLATLPGGNPRTAEVELVYRSYRAERGRATTVLRWGELLEYVKNGRFDDHFLILTRVAPGQFDLEISPDSPR